MASDLSTGGWPISKESQMPKGTPCLNASISETVRSIRIVSEAKCLGYILVAVSTGEVSRRSTG